MQYGKLVYLMGPSGAGKDTLLSLVKGVCHEKAEHLRPLYVATRHITRPPCDSIEKHISLSKQEFLYLLSKGHFILHWQSHGHLYGIGKDVNVALAHNCLVLMNGSRAYLPQAQRLFPDLVPILLQVDQEVLQTRLWTRGREDAKQIQERMERCIEIESESGFMYTINNSGTLEGTLHTFKNLLTQLRTISPQEQSLLLPTQDNQSHNRKSSV